MDGHAENAPESLSDLASFLSDTPPEPEQEEGEATPDESTAEGDTDDEETAGQEDSEDDESKDEEAEDTPAPERKLKVTVKGDDGTDQEIEVDEAELVKGYHRQADYTRKTQELAQREHQAVEHLKTKYDEFSNSYLQKAEASRAAIVQLAGLKSEAEMAQLAQSDPAGWVAENQRRQSIIGVVTQLDQEIAAEREAQAQRQQQQAEQMRQQAFQKSWAELSKDGIDRDKLAKVYGDVSKNYGIKPDELANVYDYRLVRMMRDAAAYRELQAQKPAAKQRIESAPKLPNRQGPTASERKSQQLDSRFKGGKAKLNDLAAYLR